MKLFGKHIFQHKPIVTVPEAKGIPKGYCQSHGLKLDKEGNCPWKERH